MQLFKKMRPLLAAALTLAVCGTSAVHAQNQAPIKVGMSVAQTGPLAGGGMSALLALQMWRDDVNARGGLLGRKVELIAYDDQGTPAAAPAIYTKLLDVDKADLLISPYGTNPTAAVLPLIKQRNRMMMGHFAFSNNETIKHDRYFQIAPWGRGADAWASAFIEPGKAIGAKTIAFLAAENEFSQTLAGGARELAKREGLKIVYDQNYPGNTVEFSPMLRAIRAAKPDLVFVASYPADSAAIIRSVNEIGVGSDVKMFGGAMVGLHYASSMQALGPMLNGITNYAHYVPEPSVNFPGMEDFLKRYSTLATQKKIDPLGYYLAPFSYAAGEVLERAVTATKSLDDKVLADWIHNNEIKTIVGDIKFGPTGEWEKPRVLETQYQGVTGRDVEQFRQAGRQVVVFPPQYKSGELRYPFEKARK